MKPMALNIKSIQAEKVCFYEVFMDCIENIFIQIIKISNVWTG